MKKSIVLGIACLATVSVAGFAAKFSTNPLEKIVTDENVLALMGGDGYDDPLHPCPNGCDSKDKSGCFCYKWYADYHEYDGWDKPVTPENPEEGGGK